MTMNILHNTVFWGLLLLAVIDAKSVIAQSVDSVDHKSSLEEVRIFSNSQPSVTRSETPLQVISAERLIQSGALQLSDAVRHMAGVTLKDYGGIGGIKTVSVRGLGSQFTTLAIDGVAVNDNRNGQADLGRYLVGNVSFVSAQSSSAITARGAAAGNVINMETQMPTFFACERTNIKLGVEGGSYGLVSPSLLWEQRVGKKMITSLWGNYTFCQGNYPFVQNLGVEKGDTSVVLRRNNSKTQLATVDFNLFYPFASRQTFNAKVHLSLSHLQLPGAVSLYNTIRNSESTTSLLCFVQGKYSLLFGPDNDVSRSQMVVVGKYQYCNDTYQDTAQRVVNGDFLFNRYVQQEGYLSGSVKHTFFKTLTLNAAADVSQNAMRSNLSVNDDVKRSTLLAVARLSYVLPRFSLSASGLLTLASERAITTLSSSSSSRQYQCFSPSVGLNYKPIDSVGLRMRLFCKQTFRMPNFSEMYFLVTSRRLEPEKALQNGVGFSFVTGGESSVLSYLESTVDAYYNMVSNKIVAIPTNNMFVWSMVNMGKVDVLGFDVKTSATLSFSNVELQVALNYSYQYAVDCTDVHGKTYGHQIPYTPCHSGGLTLYCITKWVEVGYDMAAVGERFSNRQNTLANRLPGYVDQGFSLSRTFNMPLGTLRVQGRVLNVFNVQYEVVRSYPMMGRNYRLSIIYSF